MKESIFKNGILKFVSPLCICNKCPSYPGKKDPRTYCERGKSPHKISQNGCICSSCLVWKINGFKDVYYCINGKDPKSKI